MTFPSPRRLPVAPLRDDQVVYVTDNATDAEVLAAELDCPVLVDHDAELLRLLASQAPQTSRNPDASDTQTPRTSKRL